MWQILGGIGLLTGATYPIRAIALLKRTPRLWSYLVIPIAINLLIGICLYGGLVFFGWQGIENWMINLSSWFENLSSNLPAWLGIFKYLLIGLDFLLRLLLIGGLLVLIGFVLAQFGVILGSPWYGKLSEQIEKSCTGQLQIVEVGIVRDIWRAIVFELKKLALIVIVGALLLSLQLAPGIGTIVASIGGIALTATLVCLDFLDAPLERRRLRFRHKLGIVYRSLPASAGFSLVCLALISVPLVNLVTIPLCVTAGTLFFCDRVLPQRWLISITNPSPALYQKRDV